MRFVNKCCEVRRGKTANCSRVTLTSPDKKTLQNLPQRRKRGVTTKHSPGTVQWGALDLKKKKRLALK